MFDKQVIVSAVQFYGTVLAVAAVCIAAAVCVVLSFAEGKKINN